MKFKQNGVSAESQKKKGGIWVSVFPFLKPRCTLKSVPGHTLYNLAQGQVFLSNDTGLLTSKDRPLAELRMPHPSKKRAWGEWEEETCLGSQ